MYKFRRWGGVAVVGACGMGKGVGDLNSL